jgi:hypothetical protein
MSLETVNPTPQARRRARKYDQQFTTAIRSENIQPYRVLQIRRVAFRRALTFATAATIASLPDWVIAAKRQRSGRDQERRGHCPFYGDLIRESPEGWS